MLSELNCEKLNNLEGWKKTKQNRFGTIEFKIKNKQIHR